MNDPTKQLGLGTKRDNLRIEFALLIDDMNKSFFGILPAPSRELVARFIALLQGIIEALPDEGTETDAAQRFITPNR
jgi:hypothetical protein